MYNTTKVTGLTLHTSCEYLSREVISFQAHTTAKHTLSSCPPVIGIICRYCPHLLPAAGLHPEREITTRQIPVNVNYVCLVQQVNNFKKTFKQVKALHPCVWAPEVRPTLSAFGKDVPIDDERRVFELMQ